MRKRIPSAFLIHQIEKNTSFDINKMIFSYRKCKYSDNGFSISAKDIQLTMKSWNFILICKLLDEKIQRGVITWLTRSQKHA